MAVDPQADPHASAAGEPREGMGVWKDLDALRAMMHPLRMRAYVEAVKGPVSAKELSARFDVPLQRMSYHVRLLADAGLLAVVRKTPRRGAVETHYRAVATLEVDDDALTSSPELLSVWTQMLLRVIAEDADHAVEQWEGGAADVLLARAHLAVRAGGGDRIRQEVLDFYDRLAQLEEELRAAPGDEAEHVTVAMILHPGARDAGRNGPIIHQVGNDRLTIPPD